jgi:hypothetical protein
LGGGSSQARLCRGELITNPLVRAKAGIQYIQKRFWIPAGAEITANGSLHDRHARPCAGHPRLCGNVVPQLHVHIVARWKDDPLWRKPVWGHVSPRPGDAAAFGKFVGEIQRAAEDHPAIGRLISLDKWQ